MSTGTEPSMVAPWGTPPGVSPPGEGAGEAPSIGRITLVVRSERGVGLEPAPVSANAAAAR